MNLLLLGSLFPPDGIFRYRALSPAGNRWKLGLVGGLRELGVGVAGVGHAPEPAFPRGRLRLGHESLRLDREVAVESVGYINLPRARHWMLGWRYAVWARRILRSTPCDAVVTYNLLPEMPLAVRLIRKEFRLPWISIVADAEGEGDFWSNYRQSASGVDGHAFLSYRSYEECPFPRKHHVDGGIDRVRFAPDAPKEREADGILRIGYTGMLSSWTGSAMLGDMMRLLKGRPVELHVCGRGDEAPLRSAAADGARVVVHGLVSEEKLREVCDRMDAYINPRPSKLAGNTHNFPSKLLEYLAYGLPVISTYTPGIAPEYLPHIVVPTSETPEGFAEAVDRLLGMDDFERSKGRRDLFNFLQSKKTWNSQAAFFEQWLRRDFKI